MAIEVVRKDPVPRPPEPIKSIIIRAKNFPDRTITITPTKTLGNGDHQNGVQFLQNGANVLVPIPFSDIPDLCDQLMLLYREERDS